MSKRGRDKAHLVEVEVGLPFGLGKAKWTPDTAERDAAWRLYVELVTRIAVEELPDDRGLVREAMNSLYSLFGTTREILKAAGPQVGASIPSVGGLAIRVLNAGLRPFLSKWHPELLAWEATRPNDCSITEHERKWSREKEVRQELAALRVQLNKYSRTLGLAAGLEQ